MHDGHGKQCENYYLLGLMESSTSCAPKPTACRAINVIAAVTSFAGRSDIIFHWLSYRAHGYARRCSGVSVEECPQSLCPGGLSTSPGGAWSGDPVVLLGMGGDTDGVRPGVASIELLLHHQ